MNTTQTKLLDIKEAAARLHICTRMLYRLVQQKELPPMLKLGGKSLVLESDVETYIARMIQKRSEP